MTESRTTACAGFAYKTCKFWRAEPRANAGVPDWDAVLASYEVVRVEHCPRVQSTARAWGDLEGVPEGRTRSLNGRDAGGDHGVASANRRQLAYHPTHQVTLLRS